MANNFEILHVFNGPALENADCYIENEKKYAADAIKDHQAEINKHEHEIGVKKQRIEKLEHYQGAIANETGERPPQQQHNEEEEKEEKGGHRPRAI